MFVGFGCYAPPSPPLPTRASDLNLILEDDSVKIDSLVQSRNLKIMGWYKYVLTYLHCTRYFEGVILLTPCQLGLFWMFCKL